MYFYYTAHRLCSINNPLKVAPKYDILIVRREMRQLKEYSKLDYRTKVIGLNQNTLDVEFLLIFEHGLDQQNALEALENGKIFWQESSNQYLHTGFGLSEELALKALLEADKFFKINLK